MVKASYELPTKATVYKILKSCQMCTWYVVTYYDFMEIPEDTDEHHLRLLTCCIHFVMILQCDTHRLMSLPMCT